MPQSIAPGDGGATFEITLVAMEPVEGPLEGLVKERSGRRLGGFVFGGDDFALVPGGANEVVEGFEFEEALGLEFVVQGVFEVEIELVLRFGDAEAPGEPTGAHGVLGRAGLACFGARAGGQLRIEPVDIGAGVGTLDRVNVGLHHANSLLIEAAKFSGGGARGFASGRGTRYYVFGGGYAKNEAAGG